MLNDAINNSATENDVSTEKERRHVVILTDDDIDYSNGSYVLMGLGSDDVYINSYEVAEYAKVDLNKGKYFIKIYTCFLTKFYFSLNNIWFYI